jgi:ATP-dependent Clp protease adaptor protein ClpS
MRRKKYQRNNKCGIVLLNDDVNTFDHVTKALQEVCGHNYIQATQCAHIVHGVGKCEIFKDKCLLVEEVYEELKELGLIVKLIRQIG